MSEPLTCKKCGEELTGLNIHSDDPDDVCLDCFIRQAESMADLRKERTQ